MSFIQRELDRVQMAIPQASASVRDRLMAAQQALSWALDPVVYAPPYSSITGNPVAAEGCSAESRPPQS